MQAFLTHQKHKYV